MMIVVKGDENRVSAPQVTRRPVCCPLRRVIREEAKQATEIGRLTTEHMPARASKAST